MSLLFESIACLNGELQNLNWHETRLNRSRKLVIGAEDSLALSNISVPADLGEGLCKCRVSYGASIHKVEFKPYVPKQPRYFKLVEADIEYQHKYSDRSEINQLLAINKDADEIVIVKNKMITDSSIGNLVFYDGSEWHTPEKPLLEGTMRASLLASNQIKTVPIFAEDLVNYQGFMVINALNPFDLSRTLPIAAIHE